MSCAPFLLAIFGLPGGPEVLVILLVGLLLFGGRLPEVGRSLGRSLVEFRKGLRGLKDEVGLDKEIQSIRRDLDEASRTAPTHPWPESDRSPWNEVGFDDSLDSTNARDAKKGGATKNDAARESADENADENIIDTEAKSPVTEGSPKNDIDASKASE